MKVSVANLEENNSLSSIVNRKLNYLPTDRKVPLVTKDKTRGRYYTVNEAKILVYAFKFPGNFISSGKKTKKRETEILSKLMDRSVSSITMKFINIEVCLYGIGKLNHPGKATKLACKQYGSMSKEEMERELEPILMEI